MYNLNGIYYQMISDCSIFIICGVVLLGLSRFWIVSKRNIKEMMLGAVCILLAVSSIIYHIYIISNAQILIHEGYFFSENRENRHILEKEFTFTDNSKLKPVFYLDVFSKKEVYPDKFKKDTKYRIFYEEQTKVIVKVEVIE